MWPQEVFLGHIVIESYWIARQKWDGSKTNWLIETCAICTKLKFQSVKNMLIKGCHLSNRSLCNLSFVCQLKTWA